MRRGMAAIEESLRRGPVHIVKHNKLALSYCPKRIISASLEASRRPCPGMTALQWLLSQPDIGTRDKADIDITLGEERDW